MPTRTGVGKVLAFGRPEVRHSTAIIACWSEVERAAAAAARSARVDENGTAKRVARVRKRFGYHGEGGTGGRGAHDNASANKDVSSGLPRSVAFRSRRLAALAQSVVVVIVVVFIIRSLSVSLSLVRLRPCSLLAAEMRIPIVPFLWLSLRSSSSRCPKSFLLCRTRLNVRRFLLLLQIHPPPHRCGRTDCRRLQPWRPSRSTSSVIPLEGNLLLQPQQER